ncbi:MAG: hypothetical protein SFY66_16635 [Oculatellaceae cyanobacterium bins.114]|nr:hypothetical protein [Oculatellaceae cyanobacterium bins.114]
MLINFRIAVKYRVVTYKILTQFPVVRAENVLCDTVCGDRAPQG